MVLLEVSKAFPGMNEEMMSQDKKNLKGRKVIGDKMCGTGLDKFSGTLVPIVQLAFLILETCVALVILLVARSLILHRFILFLHF